MSVGSYRLDPLDRSTIGPFGRREQIVMAACVFGFLLCAVGSVGALAGLAFIGVGLVVCVPIGDESLIARLPVWSGWVLKGRRRRHWVRTLHLTTGAAPAATDPVLPDWLGGLSLLAHPDDGWAAIHDKPSASVTALLQIAGRGFTNLAKDQMDMLLSGWGSVFSCVPADDGLVRLCWSDIARRMPVVDHVEWAAANGAGHDPLQQYLEFAGDQTPMRHDLVLSVTITAGPVKTVEQQHSVLGKLATVVREVIDALDEAQLDAHGPLSGGEIAYLIRAGLVPTSVEPTSARVPGSLVQRLGLMPIEACGPMQSTTSAKQVDVDDVTHRAFWIEKWPEQSQQADWFDKLISADVRGAAQRIVTVVVEPVRVERALSELQQAANQHGADAANAGGGGLTKWNSFKQRKAQAVRDREHELANGADAVAYAGFVLLTVEHGDDLARASKAFERSCTRQRVRVRPLWKRMELGVSAALPLGLGLSREPF